MSAILGIHHVTAIASDAQRNLDFYAGVLGLRLVKRTVNFHEERAHLGESLRLPPRYEPQRAIIETSLPEIHLPARGDQTPGVIA